MIRKAWTIREFEDQDIAGILELGKVVFPEAEEGKFDRRFWAWEFMDNPTGQSRIWVAVDRGNDIVGHYAIIPTKLKAGTHELTASIVVDVMIHPNYRRQGMFEQLGRLALEQVGKEGLKYSYGFPVRPEVMPGHLKVGWRQVFSIPVLVRPVRIDKLLKRVLPYEPLQAIFAQLFDPLVGIVFRKKRVNLGSSVEIRNILSFDEPFDELWLRNKDQFPFIQVRDRRFLNWRYFQNPCRKYEVLAAATSRRVLGYIVSRRVRIFEFNCLAIVDFLIDHSAKEALELLLNQLIYEASKDHFVDLIACMITPGNPYSTQLRRHLFLPSGKKFWFIVRANAKDPITDEMSKVRNWFLTWGDTDVI